MSDILTAFTALLGAANVLTGDAARPFETPVAGADWQPSLAVLRPGTTAQVPVIFGTVLITGPNVVWAGDLKVDPIKKKGGKK